ncbi:MAG: L,D-transpeptidase family protein [Candidatus Omnitrophica bacterium]|nr:L,D-transpeptidase family protein [Candidatus Omnitrophota bacterium]
MRTRIIIITGVVVVFGIALLIAFGIRGRLSKNSLELLKQIEKTEDKGNLLEAKSLYTKLISRFPNSPQISLWQKKSDELNIKLLFSPIITEGSIEYEIKAGDSLSKIAKKFNTTVPLLMKSNGFSSDRILPGRKIKVWNRPFGIIVDKSQNLLILKSNDDIIKTYSVSTGKDNSTPIGTFKIMNKLVNPVWYKQGAVVAPDSPENVLGPRWMGLDIKGYGIHGTNDDAPIGKQATEGCVRMTNPEIEELYMIVPLDTEVTIID